jgi:hypothetical protein
MTVTASEFATSRFTAVCQCVYIAFKTVCNSNSFDWSVFHRMLMKTATIAVSKPQMHS